MIEEFLATNKTDADLIRNIIGSYTFIDFGIVSAVGTDTVDVTMVNKSFGNEVRLTGVELLSTGSAAYSIRVEPSVGDLVLLLSLRSYISKVADVKAPIESPSRLHYDLSSVKAIQIAPPKSESTVVLTVTTDGKLEITATGGVAIDAGAGLISINNGVSGLAAWLQGLVSDLQGLVTMGAPPTHTMSPTTVAALTARLAELATFME